MQPAFQTYKHMYIKIYLNVFVSFLAWSKLVWKWLQAEGTGQPDNWRFSSHQGSKMQGIGQLIQLCPSFNSVQHNRDWNSKY